MTRENSIEKMGLNEKKKRKGPEMITAKKGTSRRKKEKIKRKKKKLSPKKVDTSEKDPGWSSMASFQRGQGVVQGEKREKNKHRSKSCICLRSVKESNRKDEVEPEVGAHA